MASELEVSEQEEVGNRKEGKWGWGRKNEDRRLLFSIINLEEFLDSCAYIA